MGFFAYGRTGPKAFGRPSFDKLIMGLAHFTGWTQQTLETMSLHELIYRWNLIYGDKNK